MRDLITCAFHSGIHSLYQLAAVITHLGLPDEDAGHRITFLGVKRLRFISNYKQPALHAGQLNTLLLEETAYPSHTFSFIIFIINNH
jgi:hypothetical protein